MRYYTLLLMFLITGLLSFKLRDSSKNKGMFYATVDGKNFCIIDDQFSGLLIQKAGSMDGRTMAHTIISLTFEGPSYDNSDHSPFNETVQFEINYAGPKTGITSFSVDLQYQSTVYSMLKEESQLNVTDFSWEPDHKHFRLSADFNCKMRSWAYPIGDKKDVSLRGEMTNIPITVPGWIVANN